MTPDLVPSTTATGRDRARPTERGSGTLLVTIVCALTMVLAVGVGIVISYAIATHRARGAADLVALSAAISQSRGADGCAAARQAADNNAVRLTECTVHGDASEFAITVVVTEPVAVQVPGLPTEVPASATAGRMEPD